MPTLPRLAACALACAAVVQISSSTGQPRAAAAPLATGLESGLAQEPPQQASAAVRRSRYIGIDFSMLRNRAQRQMLREPVVTLELFPDVTIFATFERYDRNPDGITWVGRVEGDPMSTVTLVYRGTTMTGSIITAAGAYQIRPAPENIRNAGGSGTRVPHLVVQIDQDQLPREAEPIESPLTMAQIAAAADNPMRDTGDLIDLMVVYTPTARTWAGGDAGMANLINLGVSETNTSYANSGVNQRIRLVHTAEVNYVESPFFSTNLTGLASGSGALSGVAALRNTHGADLVMMLVRPTSPDACGIAFIMTNVTTAFQSNGYSVTDTTCVAGYTFAHELGHNMGARHDWFVDTGTTPFRYAHGYVNPAIGQRWRTVMAYPDMCNSLGFNCTRVLYWANPEKRFLPGCDSARFNCNQLQYWFYPGAPMGVPPGTSITCAPRTPSSNACDADDRRALNETAFTVANFRQAVK